VIPQTLRDRTEEKRRLRENCALCELRLDSGAAIFWSGSADDMRHAHVACIDWSTRESPARDLVKRLRATRRKLVELDRALLIAETLAHRINDGWPDQATKRALRYFKLIDRIKAVVFDVTGGW
jgi:hypothetical protein